MAKLLKTTLHCSTNLASTMQDFSTRPPFCEKRVQCRLWIIKLKNRSLACPTLGRLKRLASKITNATSSTLTYKIALKQSTVAVKRILIDKLHSKWRPKSSSFSWAWPSSSVTIASTFGSTWPSLLVGQPWGRGVGEVNSSILGPLLYPLKKISS